MALFTANPNTGVAPLLVDFTNATISSNTVNTIYEWTFGDGNSSTVINPSNTFNIHGTYTISLVATLGVCTDTAYSNLIVDEDVAIIIPNFFTPDGNGQNDVFSIHGIEKYPNNTLEIYNRWGALVYLKKGYNNSFDGKSNQPSMGTGMLPSGTYFIALDLGDGTTKPYHGYLELKY